CCCLTGGLPVARTAIERVAALRVERGGRREFQYARTGTLEGVQREGLVIHAPALKLGKGNALRACFRRHDAAAPSKEKGGKSEKERRAMPMHHRAINPLQRWLQQAASSGHGSSHRAQRSRHHSLRAR